MEKNINIKEENNVENNKKEKKKSELYLWIRDLVFCILIAWFFITFIAQNTLVIGDSMDPTLSDGDYLIINKFVYNFSEPKQYDIVVFPFKESGSDPFIKRIIGIPGDEIDIIDGCVYVNGEKIVEDYTNEITVKTGDVQFPFTVPEGEYFVLGDNRDISFDSRYSKVGTIAKEDIIGKAGIRIWPLTSFGTIY